MNHLQNELDEIARVWDHHVIRTLPRQNVPSGRPNVMYEVPQLYGTHDCINQIISQEVQACRDECIFRDVMPFDEDVTELCMIIIRQNNMRVPMGTTECVTTYFKLRQLVRQYLNI